MNNKPYILVMLGFLFIVTLVVREEVAQIKPNYSEIFTQIKNAVKHYFPSNPRKLTIEERMAQFCTASVNFTKNVTSIGDSFVKGLGGEKTRELITNVINNGLSSITANIMGTVKTCMSTAILVVMLLLSFLVLLIGFVFCSSCHCCGACCYCCCNKDKGKLVRGTKAYVCEALLIGAMGALGVMAFFGSGFSTKVPTSVNTMMCSIALVSDDLMNGINKTFALTTDESKLPSWLGVDNVITKAKDVLDQVGVTIGKFPSGSMPDNSAAFTAAKTDYTSIFAPTETVSLDCDLAYDDCGVAFYAANSLPAGPPYAWTPYGFKAPVKPGWKTGLDTEIDTISSLWDQIRSATSFKDQIDTFKSDAVTAIDSAQTTIDGLKSTIDGFTSKIDKYMGYADKPMKYLAVSIKWLFIGWGILGALLVVSICILDTTRCRLFWVCDHLSWIIMQILLIAVMLVCLAFTLLTFGLENGCQMIDFYYPDNLVNMPMVGSMVSDFASCLPGGNGDLITSMINVGDISDLFGQIEAPLNSVKSQLAANTDLLNSTGQFEPPVITQAIDFFKTFTNDVDASFNGNRIYPSSLIPILKTGTGSYDIEAELLTNVVNANIKEVRFTAEDCDPLRTVVYPYSVVGAISGDTCLVMNRGNSPVVVFTNAFIQVCLCSSTCKIRCFEDYYNDLYPLISDANKYLDKLPTIKSDISTAVGAPIKNFTDLIDVVIADVADMKVKVNGILDGVDCRFVDTTLRRVFYGLCGHLKNSIGGLTAVMVGAAFSNLIGLIFTINLNMYLHKKKDSTIKHKDKDHKENKH